MIDSPSRGEALSTAMKDWASATREQRILAHYFLFSFFKLSESAWYQRKVQALDGPQWQGWETVLLAFYHSDGVKSGWWPHRGNAYSPEFQAYLARSARPGAIGSLEQIFSNSLRASDV